jgi:hypothetical protein
VTRICRLHGIHRQCPDRVDTELVDIRFHCS